VAELVVATFNLHVGLDGWGVPFDPVAACAALDADVLVLEEAFTSDHGVSLAGQVAEALGYEAFTVPLAPARRWPVPHRRDHMDPDRWGPGRWTRTRSLVVDRSPAAPSRRRPPRGHQVRRHGAERGTWELAVLHRHPATRRWVAPLPQLPRDVAARQVAFVELDTPGGPFTVAGTHLAHLSQGSPRQIRALGRLLAELDGPAAVLGDTNCFGPVLVGLLPGWRRAARGRSWPAWRPVVQPDQILVNASVRTTHGTVHRLGRSDHHPVLARLGYSDPDRRQGAGLSRP
jgi:hypothetical protein